MIHDLSKDYLGGPISGTQNIFPSKMDDEYGYGILEELEKTIADSLNIKSSIFFPTGTMAQLATMKYFSSHGGGTKVAVHQVSHAVNFEDGSLELVGGFNVIKYSGEAGDKLFNSIKSLPSDCKMFIIELPLRDAGYFLPQLSDFENSVKYIRKRGGFVHLDISRIFEVCAYYKVNIDYFVELAETVFFSSYKSLGADFGAFLLSNKCDKLQLVRWRHRFGGRLYRSAYPALQAYNGLKSLDIDWTGRFEAARQICEHIRCFNSNILFSYNFESQVSSFTVCSIKSAEFLNISTALVSEHLGLNVFSMPWWDDRGLSKTDIVVSISPEDLPESGILDYLSKFYSLISRG